MKRELMKKHRYKFLLGFIILIVMSIYIFITTWQIATQKEVQLMYPIEKSLNKEASQEFLKAMEYRIYIKQLHPFFDYDSFIMTPLLEKLDYHFKKGKALLPKDSVEDIVWWVLFYKEIYGLLGNSKNDDSLWYENLPYQEFRKVHDKVYEMIMRYPDGEVYFDIPEIEQFRFKTMAILVGFYNGDFSCRYSGSTVRERELAEAHDIETVKLMTNIKEKYKLIYEKFINTSKDKEFMQREYWQDIIYISSDLIAKYTFINNTQDLPSDICYSKDVKFILEHTNSLIDYVNNNNNHQSYIIDRSLFKPPYTDVYKVFKLLEYECMNLRPEISIINSRVQQLNKNRK